MIFAQEDVALSESDSLEYNAFQERVYFWQMEKNWKFSPFDVFNIVPSLGVDLETVMKPGLSFQYGLAYVPSFLQFAVGNNQDQFNWMHGYHLRFESRFSGFPREAFYVSTEISMRHLFIEKDQTYGMEPDEFGNFAYFIVHPTLFHRFSTHVNLKFGFQKVYDKLVVDFYSGLSFRRNNVVTNTPPPGEGVENGFWNQFDWRLSDGHRFGYMTPIVGVRIGIHQPARPNLY